MRSTTTAAIVALILGIAAASAGADTTTQGGVTARCEVVLTSVSSTEVSIRTKTLLWNVTIAAYNNGTLVGMDTFNNPFQAGVTVVGFPFATDAVIGWADQQGGAQNTATVACTVVKKFHPLG